MQRTVPALAVVALVATAAVCQPPDPFEIETIAEGVHLFRP